METSSVDVIGYVTTSRQHRKGWGNFCNVPQYVSVLAVDGGGNGGNSVNLGDGQDVLLSRKFIDASVALTTWLWPGL